MFNHHPDPEIDWEIECEELENIATSFSLGLSGFGHEVDYDSLGTRLARFLDYRTLNTHILEMKRQLREHIRYLGFKMSPKYYEGAPVQLLKVKP